MISIRKFLKIDSSISELAQLIDRGSFHFQKGIKNVPKNIWGFFSTSLKLCHHTHLHQSSSLNRHPLVGDKQSPSLLTYCVRLVPGCTYKYSPCKKRPLRPATHENGGHVGGKVRHCWEYIHTDEL